MRRIKTLQIAICAAILCAALGTSARADNWDRKTVVTFANALEIPGQVLPPGTYVFKLVNLPSSRNLVQIMNEDQSFTFATLQTVSTYCWHAPDHTLFRLDERAGDSPEAIRTWYYPGDNRGVDFIYSYTNDSCPPAATDPGQ